MGRLEAKDDMNTVSTLEAINEKILSMDYSEYRAQIKTVDAQESFNGGVLVLVTGYLIHKDNVKRDFIQTFFLATQDKDYYVLNDIFRYVEEADQPHLEDLTDDTDALLTTEHDSVSSREQPVPEQTGGVQEGDEHNEAEIYNPSEHEEGSTVDDEEPVGGVINEVPTSSHSAVAEPGPSNGQEQKNSYASIVQGFCFGFVEFEMATAAQSAIEASPIVINGRQVYVEEKLTTG